MQRCVRRIITWSRPARSEAFRSHRAFVSSTSPDATMAPEAVSTSAGAPGATDRYIRPKGRALKQFRQPPGARQARARPAIPGNRSPSCVRRKRAPSVTPHGRAEHPFGTGRIADEKERPDRAALRSARSVPTRSSRRHRRRSPRRRGFERPQMDAPYPVCVCVQCRGLSVSRVAIPPNTTRKSPCSEMPPSQPRPYDGP